MKFLKTKHEKNAARITTLVVVILVLLCFVVGQDYQDLPEEYGVAINFGDTNAVNNNVQPSETTTPNETEQNIPEEAIEEVIDDVLDEAQTEEEIIEEEIIEEEIVEEEVLEKDTEEEEKIEEALEKAKDEAEKAEAAEKLLAQQEEEALKIKEAKEAAKAKAIKEAAQAKEQAKKAAQAKAAKKALAAKQAKALAAANKAAAAKAAAAKAESDRLAKAAAAAAAAKKKSEGSGGTFGFDVIENAPVFPGCDSGNNTARKQCMNDKIKKFINKNFNKILASDLGLNGIQKIFIRFTVNESGSIVAIRTKAADSKLEDEAKRVINLLPKLKPGIQQGRPASVKFDLPLSIKIN